MLDEMARSRLPPPLFEAKPHSFKVVLRNALQPQPPRWPADLNGRQVKALAFLEEHDRITNRDYQGLCPEVTSETLRLDLVDLVRRSILLRIGDKRGSYYILK
jgi:ATP-dependent DNA helicase RecG